MNARVRRIALAVAALAVSATLGATFGTTVEQPTSVVAGNSWCC
jgi:hypothetical protein